MNPQGRSGLGPIGISAGVRGRRLGEFLLRQSLLQLRALGAHIVCIDWTILKEYYGKFGFLPVRRYRGGVKNMLNRKLKLVLLPLDERPCNRLFPQHLFRHNGIELVVPEALGNKKQPADLEKVDRFLLEACRDADGLVLSLDTLLYGGLVPSRIHHASPEDLEPRLDIIRKLKQENPNLLIYGFQVIMRCPDYSSDDEEPDYYEQYGEQIHRAGEILHRSRLGLCGTRNSR